MMKKIILGFVAVIVVALLARLGWAYNEVRKDMAKQSAAQAALAAANAKAKAEEARAAAILAAIPPTPAGCTGTRNSDEVWITGKVMFPKGIKSSSTYSITSNSVTYPINPDGTFCAIGIAGQTSLITATATTTNSFVLSTLVNSTIDLQDVIIDATSTAISLVYSSPLVGPSSSPDILSTISTSTAVQKFATSISAATSLSSKDTATGGKLSTTYNAAVKSVQPKAATAPTPSKPVVTTPVVKPVVSKPAPTPAPAAPVIVTTPAATTPETPAPTTSAPTTTAPVEAIPGI